MGKYFVNSGGTGFALCILHFNFKLQLRKALNNRTIEHPNFELRS
jgi:hypothetical protein